MCDNFWSSNLKKIKKLALRDLQKEDIDLKEELDFSSNAQPGEAGILYPMSSNSIKKNYEELIIFLMIKCAPYQISPILVRAICNKIIASPELYKDIVEHEDYSVLFDLITLCQNSP
jgi:hypothetical protein